MRSPSVSTVYTSSSILWTKNRTKIVSLFPSLTTALGSLCDCIIGYDTVLLIPNKPHLCHNGSIEAEAVCDHHVDLPLAVLLSNALVGGQPRQGGLQCGQAVAGGQADEEQLTCLLRHTRAPKYRGTLMRHRKQKLLYAGGLWIIT